MSRVGGRRIVLLDDAFPGYAGREEDLYVRPNDPHWNDIGHDLAAAFLFDYLVANPELIGR